MTLTARESQVLERISTGASLQEIADDLGISVQTTKNHARAVYRKCGARGKALTYRGGYNAALQDVRASVRADILLDRGTPAEILERVTKTIDSLAKT
jgi:DNA-binding CsgD family transcriptional regulator